jgi:actin related protein 2/3 complex subunit 5
MLKVSINITTKVQFIILIPFVPPFQDAALNVVMRVLMSVKSSQMEEAVNSLDRDLLDILMKYIYKGFETPSEGSSGHLLAWHEKVHAVAGVGCIVRVLTDKKRV